MSQPSLLLVDDEPTSLLLLNQALAADYDIRLATSGPQALRLIQAAPPDLLLLDLVMPEMDGLAVCRTLKSDPATKDIPILFVTTRSGVEDETRALEAGGADFIHKPISPPVVRARVRAQLALKAQADGLRDALQSALDTARLRGLSARSNSIELLLTADGHILEANDRACAAYGYTRAELITLRAHDLRLPGCDAEIQAQLGIALREGIRFETIHVRKDGSSFPVEISSRSFEIDGVHYLHSFLQDITERRAIEHERRVLANIFTHMTEAVAVTDLELGVEQWRGAAEKIYGLSAQEMIGKRLPLAVPLDPQGSDIDRARAAYESGERFLGRMRIQRKDGAWVDLQQSSVPLRDADGKLTGWVIVGRDVTAMVAAERELAATHAALAERARELEALQAAKAELSRMVVHDLRGPLSVVLGHVDWLRDELRQMDPVPPDVLTSVEEAHAATTRVLHMVNSLLFIELAETGRLQVQPRSLDPKRFLASLARGYERAASARRVTLGVRSEESERISVDDALLSRTLENFLTNALRYTPKGGRIEVSSRIDGDEVEIAVCNTGAPIDPSVRERVFEKHVSTGDRTARSLNSGLGLYFARLATEAQGGHLGVDSTSEWPTRFWVRFPIAPP